MALPSPLFGLIDGSSFFDYLPGCSWYDMSKLTSCMMSQVVLKIAIDVESAGSKMFSSCPLVDIEIVLDKVLAG